MKGRKFFRCCKDTLRLEMECKSKKLTRRRVRHDIVVGILEAARHGESKTHIMNKVNLSFKQTEYYLDRLLSKNFIKKEGKTYKTTEKGFDVIEACKICLKLIEQ